MVVYFSGTGNSRCAARIMADKLGDELLDAGTYFAKGESAALTSQKPWVFVSPTYAWRIPRVFSDFILRCSFSGSRQAYFVMTCGTDIGGAGRYIVNLCREKGFDCMGVLPVVMPENYIAMFSAPEREEAEEIVRAAIPVIEAGAAAVGEAKRFATVKITPKGMMNSLTNGMFYAVCVKDKRFFATDKCVGCGKCAEVCQLGNVSLEGGRPVWHGACTHCMACICSCPQEAIEYGPVSRGKPRYQCPEP